MDASLNGPSGRITLDSNVLTIGRSSSNKFVVSDPKSSSHHAEIRPEGSSYTLIDLGSTNGTFVNGQRLTHHQPRPLQTGDIIRIGDTNFTYEGPVQIPPTVYVQPGQVDDPPYAPTVAVSPAYAPTVAVPFVPPENGRPQNQQPAYTNYGQLPNNVATQQPKKGRRGLWITLGVIGGILLIGCLVLGVIILRVAANRPTPAKALDTFCTNLLQGNNQAAYNQFTPDLQGRIPEQRFNLFLSLDKISACTHTNPDTNGDTATSLLTTTGASGKTRQSPVTLIQDSTGEWKISNINIGG